MLDFLKIRKKTKIEKHLEKMAKLDAKETKKLQKAEAKKLKKARKLEKKDSINVKIVPETSFESRGMGIWGPTDFAPTRPFINGYKFAMISYFSKNCSIKTLSNFSTNTTIDNEGYYNYSNIEFNFGIEAAIADLLDRKIAVEY